MFYLLTERIMRIEKGRNHRFWTVSGPFSKQSASNRAAVRAMTTYTCLSAQVVTADQLKAMKNSSNLIHQDYELTKAVRHAMDWLVPKD